MRSLTAREAGPVDLRLLPSSARVDEAGRCSIGGIDLEELAQQHLTPLFVYDEDEIRRRCRQYVQHFGRLNVLYAGKAFLNRAMVRIVREEGLGLDVATMGELSAALRSDFPPERLTFHGNNKSDDELR